MPAQQTRLWLGASKRGDQILITLLVLLFWHRHSDSHASTWLDTLDGTIHLHGPIERQARSEARPDPQRVGRFNKHTVSANVPSFPAQHRRAPFNFQLGAKGITSRPAAL